MNLDDVMAEINQFLLCPTPAAWIDVALENQELLLIDHANCEKKAASTAMNLLYRYIDRDDLLKKNESACARRAAAFRTSGWHHEGPWCQLSSRVVVTLRFWVARTGS